MGQLVGGTGSWYKKKKNVLGIRSLIPVPGSSSPTDSFSLESDGSVLTGEWAGRGEEGGGGADGREPRHAGRECRQKCPAPHPTSMRIMNPQGWEAGAGPGGQGAGLG